LGLASERSVTRYSVGMGGSTVQQGRIVGFLGEVISDQLPTMAVMPETAGHTMVDCVELDDYNIPPVSAIEAAFIGNAPLAVILVPAGATQMTLPRMMFLLKAWAPYFLNQKTLYQQGFKFIKALMATLSFRLKEIRLSLSLIGQRRCVSGKEVELRRERRPKVRSLGKL
jgi:hypothetical protein